MQKDFKLNEELYNKNHNYEYFYSLFNKDLTEEFRSKRTKDSTNEVLAIFNENQERSNMEDYEKFELLNKFREATLRHNQRRRPFFLNFFARYRRSKEKEALTQLEELLKRNGVDEATINACKDNTLANKYKEDLIDKGVMLKDVEYTEEQKKKANENRIKNEEELAKIEEKELDLSEKNIEEEFMDKFDNKEREFNIKLNLAAKETEEYNKENENKIKSLEDENADVFTEIVDIKDVLEEVEVDPKKWQEEEDRKFEEEMQKHRNKKERLNLEAEINKIDNQVNDKESNNKESNDKKSIDKKSDDKDYLDEDYEEKEFEVKVHQKLYETQIFDDYLDTPPQFDPFVYDKESGVPIMEQLRIYNEKHGIDDDAKSDYNPYEEIENYYANKEKEKIETFEVDESLVKEENKLANKEDKQEDKQEVKEDEEILLNK